MGQVWIVFRCRIVAHPANPERSDPDTEARIKPTPGLGMPLAFPMKLGSTVQIDAENLPLDHLEQCMMEADSGIVENQVRPRIPANQREWAVEMGRKVNSFGSPWILAFEG
jgi:hypothetical protein